MKRRLCISGSNSLCTLITGLLTAFIILGPSRCKAQAPKSYTEVDSATQQRINKQFINPVKPGRAKTQLLLAEVLPWVVDRYVTKADYAYISFKTVGNNLNPNSWTWDGDPFQTNQFGHPYHGSIFYNSFRSNGYSFWQSVPAVMVGSYVWETFAENQKPAPNDFINTSFGGIVLGEMTHRLANRIVNSRSHGFQKQMNEVIGLVINPINGINRVLDGKWGKTNLPAAERDTTNIRAEFDLGIRRFKGNNNNFIANSKPGWYGRISLLYGNAFEDYRTPFSNLYINAEFGQDDSAKVNVVSVYGSLAGWNIKQNEKLKHFVILSANYDYIRNEAFFYGGQSVKLNWLSEYNLIHKVKINSVIAAGPVVLAAVPDDNLYRGRNYNYTSGIDFAAGGTLSVASRLFYTLNYRGSWLQTVSGDQSHYFLHTLTSEFRAALAKGFSLCVEPGYFTLRGYYKNHDNVNRKYPYLRFSARYTFKL